VESPFLFENCKDLQEAHVSDAGTVGRSSVFYSGGSKRGVIRVVRAETS
jgi:hypothetical protein